MGGDFKGAKSLERINTASATPRITNELDCFALFCQLYWKSYYMYKN